ncbi:MAG: NADH-quinone oxidoreductase subunit NuoE [Candidatus Aminicenantes bacterium]|nr:NADH-quinone oxidoreductase subunit NuoE [Candidatus Aminicenantes bacterium]NIM81477.1 NADH-quinone oxidoreductase subunit NuoE [Candidatus Aminicenantes bacterium]NIN20843.1 NADH-quinone oxidoreductase subunit NuoE [Candidatus Aminicenantes bacterium]NIN44664.1 NADH-quinone oxidoreductase subunit NuoE [Candidatus Aminicenantes bacterium]NIN87473.1 NADH-quinone oxidoreductase subunit NuoE [Candidatus Aminicenantes bacterium]
MKNIDLNTETDIDIREVNKIIDQYIHRTGALIAILQSIQEKYSFLPQPAIKQISKRLRIPLSKVYHVATFYKAFSLKPRGRNSINVCLGTACHVRGTQRILGKLKRELGIIEGETTEDRCFTLDTVRCIGCCSLAPVMMINKDVHGRLTQEKAVEVLDRYQ